MTEENVREPWDQIHELVVNEDAAGLEQYLNDLSPASTALAVSRLHEAERSRLLRMLSTKEAAAVLGDLPTAQAADLIEEIPAEAAAVIVEAMPDHEQADVLQDISPADADAILDAMGAIEAGGTRELLQFAPDSAGGLMTHEFLAFPAAGTVGEVLEDLRDRQETYADYEVQYAYVVSDENRLEGVLRLRDLVLAPSGSSIRHIMIDGPVHVSAHTPLAELIGLFRQHGAFFGVPVTDETGRLLGVLQRSAVDQEAEHRSERSFLRVSGIVGGEEFRSMPLFRRSFRRLSWLGPNILLNIVAASVIAMYQDTIQSVIALAVFLPIISDMSGCSGNQAVAVSIRELALGLIRPTEFLRVFLKESGLGVINGLLLGLVLGLIAFLWQGNTVLGFVVGGALALNTLLSVLLGGSVPLLLQRLGVDPALAAGPILTTVTDMCGFFLILSLASVALPMLI